MKTEAPEIKDDWPVAPPVIVLVGPTAVGKTAAAVALAERIDGEIINADSVQIYAGMDIGAAKPTPQQRERIPFHLLDLVSPDRQFTVSEWKACAEQAIGDVAKRGKRPIVCGGTGLYIRALMDNWSLAATPSDPSVRGLLQREAEMHGSSVLHARLQTVDPAAAERLHPNDTLRIVRALEVFTVTGSTISEFQRKDRDERGARPALRLGLTIPREELWRRIDARVDAMLDAGLEHEARNLLTAGYSPELGALKSLGYKEIIQYIHGALDYDAAIVAIKTNTRRFAKRQQTWFRADPEIAWIDGTVLCSATDMLVEKVNAEASRRSQV